MSNLTNSRFKAPFEFAAPLQTGYRLHFNSDHSLFVTDWDVSCLELTGYTRHELGDPHLEARLFGLARETWLHAAGNCFAEKQSQVFTHNVQGKDRVIRVEHRLDYLDSASLCGSLRQVAVLPEQPVARTAWQTPRLFAASPDFDWRGRGADNLGQVYSSLHDSLGSGLPDLEQALPRAAEVLAALIKPGQIRIVLVEDGILREKEVYIPALGKHLQGACLDLDFARLVELFGGQNAKLGQLCLSTSACQGYQADQTVPYDQALACPIQASGRLCGFVSAEDHQRVWTREEGVCAALFADFCGLLLACGQAEQRNASLLGLLSGFPGMAVFVRKEKGKLLLEFVSEGCLGLTGYDQCYFMNSGEFNLLELIHPDDAATVLDYFINAGEVLTAALCFRITRKNGQIAKVCASFKPVHLGGDQRFFQGFCMDQAEFQHLHATADSNQAKRDFMAAISHELRTPLNAICGLAHLTLLTKLDKRQRGYVEKISSSAKSLMGAINDVLIFSRTKSEHNRLERIDFCPAALVEDLAQLFTAPLQERGVELDLYLSPDLPALVQGDEDKLLVILENLLDNAAKYTWEGSVSLACLVDRRDFDYCRLLFTVSDSGPGIPEQQQQKVFDAFVQASDYQTRKYGGLGLGLSISKKLAEIMGGELHLRSEDGVGTCVSFACPFSLPRCLAEESSVCVEQPGPSPCFAGQKVLLVEDNDLNQMIAIELLENVNLSVVLAENGQQALDLARQNSFDLILMDLQMPVMDGIQATRAIRKLPAQRAVPILALTAHAFEQEKQRCFLAGMDGMLSKPIEPCLLYETIARHLFADAMSGNLANQPRK